MEWREEMSKVDIGDLKKLILKQPDIATRLALAIRMIHTPNVNLGDYTSFIIAGTEEFTPEIIVKKTELLKFAREFIERHDQERLIEIERVVNAGLRRAFLNGQTDHGLTLELKRDETRPSIDEQIAHLQADIMKVIKQPEQRS
jgi:hypothetical protein